jgi:steroid 5-alpha reductase family enzyme
MATPRYVMLVWAPRLAFHLLSSTTTSSQDQAFKSMHQPLPAARPRYTTSLQVQIAHSPAPVSRLPSGRQPRTQPTS